MNIARIPAGVIFLALLVLILLIEVQWKFAAIAWIVLLGWYVLMRATLAESKEYLRNPVYIFAATISFAYAPVLAVVGMVIGDADLERIWNQNELYLLPFHLVALLFVFYSAWTAARELIFAESKTAADRAVRWERTWKPFLQLLVWPVGVWFVHKRFQDIAE